MKRYFIVFYMFNTKDGGHGFGNTDVRTDGNFIHHKHAALIAEKSGFLQVTFTNILEVSERDYVDYVNGCVTDEPEEKQEDFTVSFDEELVKDMVQTFVKKTANASDEEIAYLKSVLHPKVKEALENRKDKPEDGNNIEKQTTNGSKRKATTKGTAKAKQASKPRAKANRGECSEGRSI